LSEGLPSCLFSAIDVVGALDQGDVLGCEPETFGGKETWSMSPAFQSVSS
jgi:hypothetical protein